VQRISDDVPKQLSPADIEAFRERLCDVAEQQFAAHGPDGVTLRQLADALGVSSMTPYRYFADKDAILAAVRTRAFQRFSQAMEDARAGGTAAKRSGNAYIAFALEHRAAYRLMFDTQQPTFEAYPELVAAMDRARLTMGAGLRQLAEQGKFRGDVELSAHTFWSVLHGAVMLELGNLLKPPLDAYAIAVPVLEMLGERLGLPPAK
jgi:AcrR family transcriptional regulator